MKVQKSFCYHNHAPSKIHPPFLPPRRSEPQAPEGRGGLEKRSYVAALRSFPLLCTDGSPPGGYGVRNKGAEAAKSHPSHSSLLFSNAPHCTHVPRFASVGSSRPKPSNLLDNLEGFFLF